MIIFHISIYSQFNVRKTSEMSIFLFLYLLDSEASFVSYIFFFFFKSFYTSLRRMNYFYTFTGMTLIFFFSSSFSVYFFFFFFINSRDLAQFRFHIETEATTKKKKKKKYEILHANTCLLRYSSFTH